MRQTIILILLIFTISVNCQIQDDRYLNDLKGPVKECSEKAYSILVEKGELKPGTFIPHWSRGKKIIDKDGKVVEFQTHPNLDGKFERTVLFYDENGCLKEKKFFRTNGDLDRHFLFKCDQNGNIIQQIDYDFNFSKDPIRTITYKYSNGLLIEIINTGHGDAMSSSETFEYDKNGFLIGSTDFGTYKYENDPNGRHLKKKIILKDNTERTTKEWKYYKNGLVLQETLYYAGREAGKLDYKYVFDDKGNWIKKIEYITENDNIKKPSTITIREIKYY